MQNEIRREITIKSSQKKIYEAISDPKKVVLWFPQTLEGKYEVGEQPIFGFGEHGKSQVYIVAAKPYEYFAYRWVPGANHYLGDIRSVASTLVEFRIESQNENLCKVILTESGFENLPEAVIKESFKQNSSGWDFMLGRLAKYFN